MPQYIQSTTETDLRLFSRIYQITQRKDKRTSSAISKNLILPLPQNSIVFFLSFQYLVKLDIYLLFFVRELIKIKERIILFEDKEIDSPAELYTSLNISFRLFYLVSLSNRTRILSISELLNWSPTRISKKVSRYYRFQRINLTIL